MTDTNNETNIEEPRSRYGLLMGGTALVGSLLLATQAFAQDQDTSADEEIDEEVEQVVVTGSRIRRSGFSSAAPMDVISAESAAPQGFTDIGALLRSTTSAAGSPQVTSATSTAFVQNGGAGAETISLRGLGANRTLVLLNGRRAGPAGIRGSVSSFDMNVLPLSAIERVEILKDGASTLYGSDAVAGVINIITKKGDGGTIEGFLSQPTQSGGEEYRVNGSYGAAWDRGNFRFTVDYYRREELAKGDRDYFDCGEAYVFKGGQRADLIDPRTGEYKCNDWGWGHAWTYDYAEGFGDGSTNIKPTTGSVLLQYDYDGHLAANGLPSVNSLADPDNPYHMRTPEGWYQVNYDHKSFSLYDYDHPYQNEESLIPETERWTAMFDGEQELTDHITLYAEGLFNRRENYSNHYNQYWSYVYNDNFNFYNYDTVPDSGGALSDGWTGAQWLSPTPITDHADASNKVDYSRFVGGLRGDFGDAVPTWEFDLSFQYSKSDAEYWNQLIYNDSVQANNWAWGSCEGTVTSVRGVPCVDVDWLNPELMQGNPTQEERDFLFGSEKGSTIYEQYSVEGLVTGELIDVPAGAVGAAIGFHWRDDSILDTPGEVTRSGNSWGSGKASITEGSHTTKAIFGELDIPLLVDKPFIDSLTANFSGRYTDVSSYGSGSTYKMGLNWQVNPTIRLRATRGTSFRTPALFELYLKDEASFLSQRRLDPCYRWGDSLASGGISQRIADNCAAEGAPADHTASISATVLTGGGLGVLKAETSTAQTLGLILTPSFADLSISIDYFDIEVRDEVDQLGAATILRECYDSPDWPNEPLCDLFERIPYTDPLGGQVTEVRDSFINIASQQNRGWDINATYNTQIWNGWNMRIDTQHTIQTRDLTGRFEGQQENFNGRLGQPKWVGNLIFTFDKEDWSATWGMRFVGKGSNVEFNDGVTTTTWFSGLEEETEYDLVLTVPRWTYHNVSVSKMMPGNWLVRAGISNLFDKEPPQVSQAGVNATMGRAAFYSQYDWEGRRVFLQLKKEF